MRTIPVFDSDDFLEAVKEIPIEHRLEFIDNCLMYYDDCLSVLSYSPDFSNILDASECTNIGQIAYYILLDLLIENDIKF